MSSDYYGDARAIAEMLELDGRNADATRLIDAIDAGATGTEIMMELRWRLQRIDESNAQLSARTRGRIRDLASALGDVLNR